MLGLVREALERAGWSAEEIDELVAISTDPASRGELDAELLEAFRAAVAEVMHGPPGEGGQPCAKNPTA